MASKLEKYRSKQESKAEKRVRKTAKKALKGRKGKDVTSVIKQIDKEQSELAGIFKPKIIIKGVYKKGK